MIRINLLPVKAKQRQVTGVTQLIVGGVIILIVFTGMIFHYYVFMKRRVTKLTAENQRLETEIKNLERLIGEVDQLEARERELNRKLDTIAQLKANKIGPVTMLEEISVLVPKKLWLDSLQENTVNPSLHKLTLTGQATSNETIAEFMTKLEESEYFQSVRLVKTTYKKDDALELQNFQITADLVFKTEKSSDENTQAMR